MTPLEKRTFRALWCPPRFTTLLFVAFDISSFFVQLVGGATAARAIRDKGLTDEERREKQNKGRSTMRLGLSLQLICFILFAVVGTRFILISRRWAGTPLRYGSGKVRWQRLNWTVNGAATLILVGLKRNRALLGVFSLADLVQIRTIYRMFEFSKVGEKPNYILSHEWLFWVLDGLPILSRYIQSLAIDLC